MADSRLLQLERLQRHQRKRPKEYERLCKVMRESDTAYFYGRRCYDAIFMDPDIAALLGILFLDHHGAGEHIAGLRRIAHDILEGDQAASFRLARRFLHSDDYAAQRELVRSVLLSDEFSMFPQPLEKPDPVHVPSKGGRRIYDDFQKSYVHCQLAPRYHPQCNVMENYGCLEKLRNAELKLLLHGIKTITLIKMLLVPASVPRYITRRDAVLDSIEHARLMLFGVDANIFYGCNITYADLKAVASEDAAALRKLDEYLPLLRFVYPFPSWADKELRDTYLASRAARRGNLGVLNPEDYPDKVPAFYSQDLNDEGLATLRVLPAICLASKEHAVEYNLYAAEDILFAHFAYEVFPRLQLSLAYRNTGKILPTPQEVLGELPKIDPSSLELYSELVKLLPSEQDEDAKGTSDDLMNGEHKKKRKASKNPDQPVKREEGDNGTSVEGMSTSLHSKKKRKTENRAQVSTIVT